MKESIDFEELFTQTQSMIYNLGMRLFRRNEEDAMDFVQDVYLQAYRKIGTFQGKSKPSTWLYSLALNLGLGKIRKNKKNLLVENKNSQLDQYIAPEDDQPDKIVLDMLNKKDVKEKIEKALWELDEAYRLPMVLFFFEDMPYKEIARSLNIPEGTIKSNVYRGKIQLRNTLGSEVSL